MPHDRPLRLILRAGPIYHCRDDLDPATVLLIHRDDLVDPEPRKTSRGPEFVIARAPTAP